MKSAPAMTLADDMPSLPRLAVGCALLALLAEITAIAFVYKHAIDFTCIDHWPVRLCDGINAALLGVYCALAALALLAVLAPAPFRLLLGEAGARAWPVALNLAGALLTLAPVPFMVISDGSGTLLPALACWAAGMALLLGGIALFLAPVPRWRAFAATTGGRLLTVLVVGALAPWLSEQIRPVWRFETIADLTFGAVVRLLDLAGYALTVDPVNKVIGNSAFSIRVAPQCSGIEGIALVTVFISLYLWLFRKELRFPLVLLLYPFGLAASAAFNVLRIALLLAIGLEGNPELAVGGFHSHAGWLMFTLVALGIVALARMVPALQRAAPAGPTLAPPPLLSDPAVARLLPFAVFMFSALLAQVLSQSPGVVYPARVVLMAGVLALFWRLYAALPWRLDPVALAIGALVGVAWVAIPVPEAGTAPYGALSGGLLVAWFVFRGVGTILLVPLIEELFFRGYLERLLTPGRGQIWALIGACATAALFAALHDRWIEAFAAGLLFSWAMRRRGNLCDAIVAHAVANAVVFAAAVLTGNLAII